MTHAPEPRPEAIKPMLGKLVRELPRDGYLYEPKWDGFRALASRRGADVELYSRHQRPFARYFPELVEAFTAVGHGDLVIDGEILVRTGSGSDFSALMARLHPARSRVARLAAETPATFVAFDVLEADGDDVMHLPLRVRRALLERLLHGAPGAFRLTEQTDDVRLAEQWLHQPDGAVDGVMAKRADSSYEPGARAMLKVKLERTADCVIAGVRAIPDPEPRVTSLLLGVYDREGALKHVGVAASFSRSLGRELFVRLAGLVTELAGHPWEHGFLVEGGAIGRLRGAAGRWVPGMPQDWLPVRPQLVCEVAYDRVDGARFRHPARLRRLRDDREPASCTLDQLSEGLDAAAGDGGR